MSDIKKWQILEEVDKQLLSKVRFVCVFGDDSDEVLMITKYDEVYGFGFNRDGCLGLGHKEVVESPKLVTQLTDKQVVNIYYGYSHVIAITKSGQLYSWGKNDCGQLGSNDNIDSYKPKVMDDMSAKDIIDISCGSFHTLLLTKRGVVYGFGHNYWGQIGCENTLNQLKAIKIGGFDGEEVSAISCGSYHSMALTVNGIVFCWGNNNRGQLGVGNYICRTVPHKIKFNISATLVRQIACGQFHSLCLTNNHSIYAFGDNDCGQIGTNDFFDYCDPVQIDVCNKFTEIASEFKSDISIAKSSNGLCYVWGKTWINDKHRLISTPMETEIESIRDMFPIHSKRNITHKLIELKNHTSSPILNNLKMAFNDPKLSDFTLHFTENVIYVNMSYLKIRCPQIQTTFPHIFTNSEVVLNYYELWFAFIQYLYTDCLQIEVENAIDLYHLAEKLSEDELKLNCFEVIENGIEVNNVFTLYSIAYKYGIKQFDQIFTHFAANNLKEVIKSEAFDTLDPLLCKQFMKNAVKLGFLDSNKFKTN